MSLRKRFLGFRYVLCIVLSFEFAGGIFGFGSALAATQVIQNRDEPGRVPYRAQATASCSGLTSCKITFPNVVASTRAVIEHASCHIVTTNYRGLILASLFSRNLPSFADALTFSSYSGPSDQIVTTLNSATLYYVEAGDAPVIFFSAGGKIIGVSSCFLSGYSVALP